MHIRSQTPYGSKECVRKRKTGANQHAFLLQNCFHNLDSLKRNGVVCRSILFMFLFASLLFAYNVWGEERPSERWMLPRQFGCIELPIERIHINSFSIPYFSFSYELWMWKKTRTKWLEPSFSSILAGAGYCLHIANIVCRTCTYFSHSYTFASAIRQCVLFYRRRVSCERWVQRTQRTRVCLCMCARARARALEQPIDGGDTCMRTIYIWVWIKIVE